MVVWLKPCESRSSPGFIPKTPLLTQRGFSLCAGNAGSAGRWPAGALLEPLRAAAPTKVADYRWQGDHRWIHALRGCSPRGARAPTTVGRFPHQAHAAIVCQVDPRHAWMPLCGTTAPTTMGRYRRDPSRRTRKKRRRPAGAVFTWIVLKAEIRQPAPRPVTPAVGTPTLHRPAFPPATAVRGLRQLLPPPAQHSAAWPGPSAPRSG